MSMDDQYREMVNFRQNLVEFNELLQKSMRDLERQHERLSPLWQDEMRRHYDQQWDPLKITMEMYVTVEGPNYVEFLSIKAFALESYLYGNQ